MIVLKHTTVVFSPSMNTISDPALLNFDHVPLIFYRVHPIFNHVPLIFDPLSNLILIPTEGHHAILNPRRINFINKKIILTTRESTIIEGFPPRVLLVMMVP